MTARAQIGFGWLVAMISLSVACDAPLRLADGSMDADARADVRVSDAADAAVDVPRDVVDVSDIGPADVVPVCTAPMVLCGRTCIDTMTDRTNCGACGEVCPGTQMCNMGVCRLPCAPAQTACGTGTLMACVDTEVDLMNCGTCGNACVTGQRCAFGVCECPIGRTLCGGACVDTSTDSTNCGACGRTCTAPSACLGNFCQSPCTAPRMVCTSSARLTSECADIQTHPEHCGACNRRCMPGSNCNAGACACPAGAAVCSGRCANLSFEVTNCGVCGRTCAPGQACSSGTCTCAAPQQMCGAVCTNISRDRLNCGSCGRTCIPGQLCNAGTCACPSGELMCGSVCSNTMVDSSNCGGCGIVCPGGGSCAAGVCSAPAPAGRYTFGVSSAPFGDACGAPGAIRFFNGVDDAVAPGMPIPFPFRFYGIGYTQVRPSSNGYVIFGPGSGNPSLDNNYRASGPLPDTSRPRPAAFILSTDLYQRAIPTAGMCVATVGTAPNRRMVIQTTDAGVCCGEDQLAHFSFQVVLNEADSSLDFLYARVDFGSFIYNGSSLPVVIGVQDAMALRGSTLEFVRSAPPTMVNNTTRLHLTYIP